MLENKLNALEEKIDALLAGAESQNTSNAVDQNQAQGSEESKVAKEK